MKRTRATNRLLTLLMHQRGFNSVVLARRLGVLPSHVNHLEKGRRLPSVSLALRLAKLLGTDVETLFGRYAQYGPARHRRTSG